MSGRKRSLIVMAMLSRASLSLAFNHVSSSLVGNNRHLNLSNLHGKNQQHNKQAAMTILPASVQSDDMMSQSSSSSSQVPLSLQNRPSHVLSMDEIQPIFNVKSKSSGKDKVLNATGILHLAVIVSTMPFWMAAMKITEWLGNTIEGFDNNRAKFDYTGKVWCRAYLSMTDSYPILEGDVDRLKVGPSGEMSEGACLFVANHASFLDIAVLCTVLDPVFKFIAKDSLKKFPGVGTQLVGGEHVLIDRTNKRSQLKTFKQAITYLKDGIPIMAFPEGARSPDGRLMEFKGGIFSMAVKAKVPIVPLSIANTHAVMPNMGFLPVQSGQKGELRVYVHDPIDVEGKSEEEISREVREALLRELPADQHPLDDEFGLNSAEEKEMVRA